MSTNTLNRLQPQLQHGRRLLLTISVQPDEESIEPADGWLDRIAVALYANHVGCSLAMATGEQRYTDAYNYDEVLWSSNSLLQNMYLRPQLGLHSAHSLDFAKVDGVIRRFIKGCREIIKANHPPTRLGAAIIPADSLVLHDLTSGMALGPPVIQGRVIVHAPFDATSADQLSNYLKHALLTSHLQQRDQS